MKVKLSGSPAYTLAYVTLEAGEILVAEPESMAMMSAGIYANPTIEGNLGKAIARKVAMEEDFFFVHYQAQVSGAWVALAPRMPGDVMVYSVNEGDELIASSGSVLAISQGIELSLKITGLKTVFLKEGLTAIGIKGQGEILLCSYGALEVINLNIGEELVVDAGHLVAWSPQLNFDFGLLGGIIGQALTKEGVVGRFTATKSPGRVIIQTRAELELKNWILPERDQLNPKGR